MKKPHISSKLVEQVRLIMTESAIDPQVTESTLNNSVKKVNNVAGLPYYEVNSESYLLFLIREEIVSLMSKMKTREEKQPLITCNEKLLSLSQNSHV